MSDNRRRKTVITTSELTEKVFTTRDPYFKKISSPKIAAAEKIINNNLKRSDIESTAHPRNEGEILVLFIHGFAASKYCWLDPDIGNMGWVKDYQNEPQKRDFGWHAIPPPLFIPVDWTLSKQLTPIGITEIFDQNKIDWLTYSQKSAFGDILESVNELENVMNAIAEVYGDRRIIIIAHSRGGLISKKFIDTTQKTNVEKLITFGTPFGGTFMSSMETFRLPSKQFLNRVKFARRLWDVSQERKVESISTKQMAPGSEFLTEIEKKGCKKGIEYVNVAGSCSHITNVYTWRWDISSLKRKVKTAREKYYLRLEKQENNEPISEWFNLPDKPQLHVYNWILKPNKIMEIYPKIGYSEVLQGDGAVSVDCALMKSPEVKYYVIHKNHIDMTCCDIGYEIMLNEVKAKIKG